MKKYNILLILTALMLPYAGLLVADMPEASRDVEEFFYTSMERVRNLESLVGKREFDKADKEMELIKEEMAQIEMVAEKGSTLLLCASYYKDLCEEATRREVRSVDDFVETQKKVDLRYLQKFVPEVKAQSEVLSTIWEKWQSEESFRQEFYRFLLVKTQDPDLILGKKLFDDIESEGLQIDQDDENWLDFCISFRSANGGANRLIIGF